MGLLTEAYQQRETIASYSVLKILPLLLFALLLGAINAWSWYSILTEVPGAPDYSILPDYVLYVGTALYLLFLPFVIEIIRQVLFRKRRAAWVEKGHLIYIHRILFSVPCADIVGFSPERYGRYNQQGIATLRKGGQKKILPVGMLSESPEVILERLKNVCLK
jgi:hypothetical protein